MSSNLTYIEKRRSVRLRRSKLLSITKNIEYKIATTTSEMEQAFELVTQQYISVGLHKSDDYLRLTKYHLLPESKVFIAIRKDADGKETVVGTFTLVIDSSMGLPMDEIYKEKLERLRITGLHLSEVIGLAVSPGISPETASGDSAIQNNIVIYLFKICLQYAKHCAITDFLCSVTKKHISFYEELLLFKPIGELTPYSYANGLSIQGHRLNICQANKDFKKVYSGMEFDADLHRFFFTETRDFNRPYGRGEAMTQEQLRYFLEKRTQLLSTLSNTDKSILRHAFSEQYKTFAY